MVTAYAVFLGQAIVRGRQESESVEWDVKEIGLAVAGILVLAGGAYAAVRATEHLVGVFGISKLIGGLFIIGIVAAAPEIFATWSVIRSGQVTAGTTSVIGDNAVTMTIAFFPLGLVTVPIWDFQLFWVNLAFVALMPAAYAVSLHWGGAGARIQTLASRTVRWPLFPVRRNHGLLGTQYFLRCANILYSVPL